MAKAEKSIFDLLDAAEQASVQTTTVNAEVAATAEQQKMMEAAGELQRVHYIGPHGKYIPGFYSEKERAFLPEFVVE